MSTNRESKPNVKEQTGLPLTYSSATDTEAYDQIDEKKLMRKIDWRLLPILGALYSISVIDRINIANARVAGMGTDLALQVGHRYTIVLVLFFPPYALLELPSNIILRKVGSANWLSLIAFSWGAVILGQGFIKSWHALAICRVLLGVFEAGFFPGCIYLITCWYVRYETQKRITFFYLISIGIGGLASLLASGLMQMEGVGGLRGWRWIFIIEGILTCVVAASAWFIILDFPDKAEKMKFLTHQEASFVLQRIEADRGDSIADPVTMTKVLHHLSDPKLWAFATMCMSTAVTTYALSYFLPVILVGMGYSPVAANALAAPPAITAVFTALTFAWVGDKYRVRSPIIASQSIFAIIGLMIVAYANDHGVRYFGVFLGMCGSQGNVPAIITYQSNNIRGQSKRAVASALLIGFAAIGGIIASTTFRQQDAPRYTIGLWVAAGLQFYILGALSCTTVHFWKTNKKIERQVRNGETVEAVEGQVGFKYTL